MCTTLVSLPELVIPLKEMLASAILNTLTREQVSLNGMIILKKRYAYLILDAL